MRGNKNWAEYCKIIGRKSKLEFFREVFNFSFDLSSSTLGSLSRLLLPLIVSHTHTHISRILDLILPAKNFSNKIKIIASFSRLAHV